MTFAQELEAVAAQLRESLSPEQTRILDQSAALLRSSGIVADALRCGELVPDFELPDAQGRTVSLPRLLDRGPVAIVFYCGSWCPICAHVLRAYDRVHPAITAMGGTLLAISPECHDQSILVAACNGLSYAVLSDRGGRVSQLFGLVHTLPRPLVRVYQSLGIDLPSRNGTKSWRLPLSSLYVVSSDGIATFALVDADQTRRLDPSELVRVFKQLV